MTKKLLLDTHSLIWLDSNPEKLSPFAIAACEDNNNELYLSVVSAWEIMIKTQINRLKLQIPLTEMIKVQQADNDVKLLSVELHHVYALDALPLYHRDPFDRLLIAQAIAENMFLISADNQFNQYPVDVIW